MLSFDPKPPALEITKDDKTALIMGVDGAVGKRCLIHLLRHPAYERVLVVLDRDFTFEHPKLLHLRIPYGELDQPLREMRVDDVFCCSGTDLPETFIDDYATERTYAYRLAKLALASGAAQFSLLSSIAADPDSVIYYRREKWDLEAAIKALDFWAVHIFRPSLVMEKGKGKGWTNRLGQMLGQKLSELTSGVSDKYRPVDPDKVAHLMVETAQRFQEGLHIYSAEFIQKHSGASGSELSKNDG